MEKQNEYKADDGWNNNYFDLLIEAQDSLDDLGYEIRNCQRNRTITEIKEEISEVIEKLEDMKSRLEDN